MFIEYAIQKFLGRRRSTTKVSTGPACARPWRGGERRRRRSAAAFRPYLPRRLQRFSLVFRHPHTSITFTPLAILHHYVDIIQSRKPPGAAETINE